MNSVRSPVTEAAIAGRQIQKRDPFRQLAPEGIARHHRAGRPVATGDDVQLGAGAIFAEHPFDIERDRTALSCHRRIAQCQAEHFHRVLRWHEQDQGGPDALALVLVRGIALAVTHEVGQPVAGRQRRRRPEGAGVSLRMNTASPGGSETGSFRHGVSRFSWLLIDQV